ncbi:hypothetical protein ACWD3J_45265 [Streptomyces sp. NPDC002755]|uniref:hypothetical protein n=1 Tax=Streptomyces sp. NPDC002884 TaxID=3154544 RepID=UPI0033237428
MISSLHPGEATGTQLAAWFRGHRGIDNLLHHVRDGHTDVAAALRHTTRDCQRPLTAIGLT